MDWSYSYGMGVYTDVIMNFEKDSKSFRIVLHTELKIAQRELLPLCNFALFFI